MCCYGSNPLLRRTRTFPKSVLAVHNDLPADQCDPNAGNIQRALEMHTCKYNSEHVTELALLCICLPSVVALQNRHWNLRPESMNCINGLMYALQRMQRTGPNSPKSTIGGGYSWSNVRARGLITRPKGTAVCFIISDVVGTLYMVERMNLGPALP